ncbi:glycogen debranching protein GlgX [Mesorhizobium sp. L-8-3]|uniref:glycogen debranching protein GlgX n=1 Tax=Mesorhizobium sp. L-8-3 TaxID=2744522 RepID=UPI0019296424|nr:glycogen debranching protein GlgX [Mesorhizobium sp. L-8-3]BCH26067.1 glycogen operon protein GlgX homolog [Mesorhizobium sp. L-8-3]
MTEQAGWTRHGAIVTENGIRFSVSSLTAERVWVSLFGADDRETGRIELERGEDGSFAAFVPGLAAGARYGLRADGEYDPARGLWFDPAKLLMDPYALAIDRPYRYDARLAARRGEGGDTAPLMPKAVAVALPPPEAPSAPLFQSGGLIYEVPVRAFTMRHPQVPEALRGTIGALAHPAVLEHLIRLDVDAVELMPVTAWIDERHLPPLGLSNAWGYNPVSFMALDPRLAPGGPAELRETVAALRKAGIGTILDLVFNHTGESDTLGPTLSLRGLDNPTYYRHVPGDPGRLVNDTGCGNTIRTDHPVVIRLILDALRHFVLRTGVDGFRFDLAPVLGRNDAGFSADAPLLEAVRSDPVLRGRVLIAEPWDVGDHGYRLGGFREPFLEWNDRYRDDVRRFWRGDRGMVGPLATRLAGSSDIFGGAEATRTLNFLAAHDGMTLADLVSYADKHNEANGEDNRDGHNENFSWNNGVEGNSDDRKIVAGRRQDVRALLATLFASRGSIMLTAGDEFGRSQGGNNNAYAQDNAVTWLDWQGRDKALETFVSLLASLRRTNSALFATSFLKGEASDDAAWPDVEWLDEAGRPLTETGWNDPDRHRLTMLLADPAAGDAARLAVIFNGDRRTAVFGLPGPAGWQLLLSSCETEIRPLENGRWLVPGRAVVFMKQAFAEAEPGPTGNKLDDRN